jgi:hypothetical protein
MMICAVLPSACSRSTYGFYHGSPLDGTYVNTSFSSPATTPRDNPRSLATLLPSGVATGPQVLRWSLGVSEGHIIVLLYIL